MPPSSAEPSLLRVEDLRVEFAVGAEGFAGARKTMLAAVDGVSFDLAAGETLGIVGESGSGKSTMALAILRMVEPVGGRILFDGRDITRLGRHALRSVRRDMQIVFQDPFNSLNPRMRAGRIVEEPLIVHGAGATAAERARRVEELFDLVGLDPTMADRFPHEFSGGQRQRLGIARALALSPKLLICDEPVSALDVSIRAQITNLLADLKRRLGLSCLFIAHDLAIVRHISDRIAVMYAGRIVELADRETLYARPRHPYTQAVLDAVPIPDPDVEAARSAPSAIGEPLSLLKRPPGCAFSTRCPKAADTCRRLEPVLLARRDGAVACHFASPDS